MRDRAHIKKRKNIFNKLQPFFCILRKELILQHCLLILMFNGLRTKVGGGAKK